MGFGSNFIKWAQTLLNGQQSSVMNTSTKAGSFKLGRGTRHGDLSSYYENFLVKDVQHVSDIFIIEKRIPWMYSEIIVTLKPKYFKSVQLINASPKNEGEIIIHTY